MKKLKFAIIGCGYWSQFQLGGWQELESVECVALFNRTKSKADDLAHRFGVAHTYNDVNNMFENEELDFVDIITDVDTHLNYVALAAEYGKHVICQKPMAPSMAVAEEMMRLTRQAGVKFFIHENYRWQPQFRRVKEILETGVIGKVFRCNTAFNTAFPLFETQPFLANLTHFALTDQGSHQFDVLRFLFGEVERITCQIQTVNPGIQGEDVATTLLQMKNGVVCVQQISFSSPLEREIFPQTVLLIEGSKGSIRLDADFKIVVTSPAGNSYETVNMDRYPWQTDRLVSEPPSIVSCNRNILDDLLGRGMAETTADDNYETVRLVWAAYESALTQSTVHMDSFSGSAESTPKTSQEEGCL